MPKQEKTKAPPKAGKPKFEKKPQATLYREAAQLIIDALKEGTAPWMKPWDAEAAASFMRPHSAISGKNYLGINAVLLMSKQRKDPRWMTFKQAQEKGWNVRKGEKSTAIYFFTPLEIEEEENGEKVKRTIPILKSYAMFNAEQIDGVPALNAPPRGFKAVDAAEEIITSCGATFAYGGDDLSYKPATDTLHMPPRRSFKDEGLFYSTAMHGAACTTAHPSRLNRKTAAFEDDPIVCAQEQMRVGIAAMMLSADLGLAHDPGNQIAYVAQWIEMLEKDPKELFRASRDAEAVRNHLMQFVTVELEQAAEVDAEVSDSAPVVDEAPAAAVEVEAVHTEPEPAPAAPAPSVPEQSAAPEAAGSFFDRLKQQAEQQSPAAADDDVMSAFDSGVNAAPAEKTEPAPALTDDVEKLIFNGNAADVISEVNEVKEAAANLGNMDMETGLDLSDLDALLGFSPSKPSKGLSM